MRRLLQPTSRARALLQVEHAALHAHLDNAPRKRARLRVHLSCDCKDEKGGADLALAALDDFALRVGRGESGGRWGNAPWHARRRLFPPPPLSASPSPPPLLTLRLRTQ